MSKNWRAYCVFLFMAVVLAAQMRMMRGDFGEDMRQGSCLFWRIECR